MGERKGSAVFSRILDEGLWKGLGNDDVRVRLIAWRGYLNTVDKVTSGTITADGWLKTGYIGHSKELIKVKGDESATCRGFHFRFAIY